MRPTGLPPFTLAERLCSSPPSDSPSSSPSSCPRAGCSCTAARAGWRVFILAASYVFYGSWDWRFVVPARRLDARQPALRQADPPHRGSRPRRGAAGRRRGRRQPRRCSATSSTPTSSSAARADILGRGRHRLAAAAARRSCCRSASRSSRSRPSATSSTSTGGSCEPVALLDFAVYLSFFPHLVAGPIVRAREFLPQLRERGRPAARRRRARFWLIVAGLFKKVVISSYLAAHDRRPGVRRPRAGTSGSTCCSAIYGYAVQIYADFSGLHRHRHRARPAARLPLPAELRRALPRRCRSRTSGGAGT